MKRVLIPLAAYLAIYYLSLSGMILPVITDELPIMIALAVYALITIIALTIVHLEVKKIFKSNTEMVGLGNKLDLFYTVTQKKMKAMLWVSLFNATGLLLTFHQWFSIYFAVILVWYLFQWPTPRKVSRLLQLRGDEREMVISKGEAFKF
ncbi:MAG: hypothetical protein JSS79_20940 [Bacteroidetes bacterium]|nr:hypothetical protein [Bacteroidota bacterium]